MRKVLIPLLVAAMAVALAIPAALAQPREGGPETRGDRTVMVEGIVQAVNRRFSSFVLRVGPPDQRSFTAPRLIEVLVQDATVIRFAVPGPDALRRPDVYGQVPRRGTLADLRGGDWVQVEGFYLTTGRLQAQMVLVQNRGFLGQVPAPFNVVARGVVTARGFASLVVVSDGVSRTILVSPATVVVGRRRSFAEIRPGDVVLVQGIVNADGTIVARQIEVTFTNF